MPFIDRADVRIFYQEHGTGAPILFLHNYFGTSNVWQGQWDTFRRHYRVIATDARAHGRSRFSGRIRLTDLAADAAAVIESLRIAPAHVVGTSTGGLTALHVAREAPGLVRTLTVIGPPHLGEPSARAYVERLVNVSFPAEEEQWEREHEDQGPHHVRSVLIPNFAGDAREQPSDILEAVSRAGEIPVPALIVGGDNDPVFPRRRALDLADRIPGAELLMVPKGGHFPHRSMPGIFNAALFDFLLRHP